MTQQKAAIRPWSKWMTIALLAMTVIFALTRLPSGYSADLERIGQGENVVVLIHDKQSAESLHAMEAVDSVRAEFGDRAVFLVADINTPEGAAFVRQQNAAGASLLLFAPDGRRLQALHGVKDVASLRMALDEGFRVD